MSATPVPATYEELFDLYGVQLQKFLAQQGLTDTETAAQEIMLRFHRNGLLEHFDAAMTFEYAGEERAANFRTYMLAVAKKHAMGLRDRERRRRDRERLVMDGPAGPVMLEAVSTGHLDPAETVESSEVLAILRAHMDQVPDKPLSMGKDGRGTLLNFRWFFDTCADHIERYGEIRRNLIARELGISVSGVGLQMAALREECAEALGLDHPVHFPAWG